MFLARRLVLAHFWVAFAGFAVALLLGEWQMVVRSPLQPWVNNPELYYRSVTAHGTVMAYVFPTLVAMGFGYAITELALGRPLLGLRWAWAGFWLVVAGTVMAAAPVALGQASVLYTFYPPMIASVFYYLGVVLVVVGSWIWVGLIAWNLHRWKQDNPGATVPLAMFGNVAGAYLWAWTSVGAASEILLLILPAALGWKDTIDAGLARVLFSWTLHAIVYFWLMPAYIAFYTIIPRAIGGRLYSDTMGRVAFVLFLVFSMPIGIHHLFADPQVGAGFKFVHAVFTAMVSVPTLLTVFTICASVEIAARLRGGKGAFGWVKALPWDNPIMLAVAFAFVMLGFGGAGGIINMSYQLNETVHNTQWVTGHFHLIFAGAIVIMYFVIAYDLWPQLLRCGPLHARLMRWQLWLWFVGMLVTTLPWHFVGLLGMPRRMAYFDYSHPALQPQAITVTISTVGGPAAGDLRIAVHLDPGERSPRHCPAGALPLQHAGARGCSAPGAEQLRAVGRPHGGADGRQLRRAHRAAGRAAGNLGAGDPGGGRAMSRAATPLLNGPVRLALISLGVLLVLAIAVGFLWLPMVKPDFVQGGLWDAICRAAGVPATWATPVARNDARASRVAMVPALTGLAGGDVGRGGTLALRCTMCHGARGVSASDIPNLAGQYSEVTYKQLVDYKNGQRRHTLMQGLAQRLSDQDIRDLAAFYAQLPRPSPAEASMPVPALVRVGDPMRNVAPCASCHGGIDQKPGSPWLEGMPHAYLSAQMRLFARGERRNDAHGVMRNVARQMSADEVEAVARYYASRALPFHAQVEPRSGN